MSLVQYINTQVGRNFWVTADQSNINPPHDSGLHGSGLEDCLIY